MGVTEGTRMRRRKSPMSLALRDQNIDLPQLRDDLFRLVSQQNGHLGRPDDRRCAARRGTARKTLATHAAPCAAVPPDVEVGLHLCYGDFAGQHFVEPKDAAKMVEFANALSQAITHKLAYIHMPVPVERSDDAFHRPLRELKLALETELYLGVVHAKDGVDGTKARIAAARRYVAKFGIATECGIARKRRCAPFSTSTRTSAQARRGTHEPRGLRIRAPDDGI
jgi:methionine synthase II (cobalamin-independent)